MHNGIKPHQEYVDANNISSLAGMHFVFVAIDAAPSKEIIVNFLEEQQIPFVDVGMGLEEIEGQIIGQLRVTANTPRKRDHFRHRASMARHGDNIYDRNIQIADLNALNAAFAVIKWKKLMGFYQDREQEHDSVYAVNINELYNNDSTT